MAKAPTNEIMPALPKGYRWATAEEREDVLLLSSEAQVMQERADRCVAELEAARLRLKDANLEAQVVNLRMSELHKKLGVEGVPGDVHRIGGKVAVCADPKKRVVTIPPKEAIRIPAATDLGRNGEEPVSKAPGIGRRERSL